MPTEPIILGIDPGLTGAIAAIGVTTRKLHWVEDMPVLDKEVIGAEVMDMLANEDVMSAMVERVSSRPGQGVTSVFRFGYVTGQIIGALQALEVPIRRVNANTWKRHMGLSKDKDASRAVACAHFPYMREHFKRVKDDGRAEAALLAEYGLLEWQGQIQRGGEASA